MFFSKKPKPEQIAQTLAAKFLSPTCLDDLVSKCISTFELSNCDELDIRLQVFCLQIVLCDSAVLWRLGNSRAFRRITQELHNMTISIFPPEMQKTIHNQIQIYASVINSFRPDMASPIIGDMFGKAIHQEMNPLFRTLVPVLLVVPTLSDLAIVFDDLRLSK